MPGSHQSSLLNGSQWVSQLVSDKHSQWSDSGPIKTNVAIVLEAACDTTGWSHTGPDSGQGEQTKVDSQEPAAREEERSGLGFSTKPIYLRNIWSSWKPWLRMEISCKPSMFFAFLIALLRGRFFHPDQGKLFVVSGSWKLARIFSWKSFHFKHSFRRS